MTVDRCICHNISLRDLLEMARRIGQEQPALASCEVSMRDELADRTGCGNSCGLCGPYIKLMLRTGHTEIPILTAEEWDRLAREDRPLRYG
jgi:BFD-like [2Fe-2S] binding domain.